MHTDFGIGLCWNSMHLLCRRQRSSRNAARCTGVPAIWEVARRSHEGMAQGRGIRQPSLRGSLQVGSCQVLICTVTASSPVGPSWR